MLKHSFDPTKPYKVIVYLRMSDKMQNPRSPDQQLADIKCRIAALGLNWQIVMVYRDDAVSGRLLWRRPDFRRMMNEIRQGTVVADLILVDTHERLGRVDEMAGIKKELLNQHGILVLTGDTNFADPTTPQGKVHSAFEQLRSTEDTRIKAHNVLRGKIDAVRQRQWPGGVAPMGYKLQSVLHTIRGREEVAYRTLVPDPTTAFIVQKAFRLAHEQGLGQTRVARALNEDPEIPQELKPFDGTIVGYWLKNEIYCGTLAWGKVCSDIIDDTHVRQRNAPEDIERVEGFCEPLVDRAIWEFVNDQRQRRAAKIWGARQAAAQTGDGKLIQPTAPGMTLKYALTGLARCGHCGRSLRPGSCNHTTKSGEPRKYISYVCPAYLTRECDNHRRIREPWLFETVINLIRSRLFTADREWLEPLMAEIRAEFARLVEGHRDQRPDLEAEQKQLTSAMTGYLRSLADPQLSPELRSELARLYDAASQRRGEVDVLLAVDGHQQQQLDSLLDHDGVLASLSRLSTVLSGSNPTELNLELSLHIDRIDCFSDRHVEIRTCKLGALAGTVEALADVPPADLDDVPPTEPSLNGRVQPRLRARLRLETVGPVSPEQVASQFFAANPHRFASLDARWFWVDRFEMPVVQAWSTEHALEVLQLQQQTKWSQGKLAEHFGKCKPTITQALRTARKLLAEQQAAAIDTTD
jgi:DNA invertase Pin-like site-specific DNA recombinase